MLHYIFIFGHFVLLACPRSIYGGVLWEKTAENTVASKPCTDAGVYFRIGPMASRYCQSGGTWANVDFTSCTLTKQATPFALVWLVVEAKSIKDVQSEQTLLEHEVLINVWQNTCAPITALRILLGSCDF